MNFLREVVRCLALSVSFFTPMKAQLPVALKRAHQVIDTH
jgi:hypothetical protein